MTKEEILKMTLEALEEACELIGPAWAWRDEKGRPAITAIKETLAQPEQEPVGYLSEGGAERLLTKKQAHEQIRSFRLFTHDVPLYTNPPQRTWVELTHSEFAEILCDNRWQGRPELMLLQAQDKLKEKNKCT